MQHMGDCAGSVHRQVNRAFAWSPFPFTIAQQQSLVNDAVQAKVLRPTDSSVIEAFDKTQTAHFPYTVNRDNVRAAQQRPR
jgi:hypothetical protein